MVDLTLRRNKGDILTYDEVDNNFVSLNMGKTEAVVNNVGAKVIATRTGVNVELDTPGLSNVDNTSDANKPLSNAAMVALAAKANLAGSPSQDFNVARLNGGPIGGLRNKLINPTFRVNQRVTTSTTADNTYIADCWRTGISAGVGALATCGVNYNGPVSSQGNLGMYSQTGPNTKPVLAASDFLGFGTPVEGFDIADMLYGTGSAKTTTLSFRAQAPVETVICVCFRNGAADRHYVAPVTIAAGIGSYSVVVPGDTVGNWDKSANLGISVWFFTACGSDFRTATPNQWSAGNKFGHASMSNILDTVSRYVQIADPQLEIGLSATPFCANTQGSEIARCQRYFEAGDASIQFVGAMGVDVATAYGEIRFRVPKRAPPSMVMGTWYYYSSGTDTVFTPGIVTTNINRFAFSGTGLVRWFGWAPGGVWRASSDL